MKTKFLFTDQTLGYALRNRHLDIEEMAAVKQKIMDMARVIFDIPLAVIREMPDYGAIDLHNIRIGVQPEAGQVRLVRNLGCGNIKIALAYELFPKLPAAVAEALEYARGYGMNIAVHITGSAEYSPGKRVQIRKLVKRYSIDTLVFGDTNGELDPLFTYWTLLELRAHVPCDIEYHGSNALGLATGNVLGAVKSGVSGIAVSIGGVGGYPAFEEVLMSISCLLQLPVDIPADMANRCGEVLASLNHHVLSTKPIIGANIFAHESGVHVDGVNKRSELYEPFTPETVGLSRKIVIGKHSGTAAIELKLKEMNVNLKLVNVSRILEKVRGLAIKQKAPVSDSQLLDLVHEVAS